MKRFYNNTLISGAFSKALRVIALLCVLLGVSSSAWGSKLYLKPNVWNSDGPCYIAYFWGGSGDQWANMTDCGEGYFSCDIPGSNHTQVKIQRKDPNSGCAHDWNGSWNDTGDQTMNGNNCITVDDWGKFSWSTYTPSSSYGFFTDGACNIKVGDTWKSDTGYGATGNNDPIDIGTAEPGASLGFWVKTYKNNAELCSPKVGIKVVNVDNDYQLHDIDWKENLEGGDELWQEDNIGVTLPTTPGTYEVRVYFRLVVKEGNNCVEKDIYLNNGGNNYKFKITIAGGGGDTPGGGGTGTEFSFVLDTKTNDKGGWINNGEVYAIFRENVGGKTGETRQVQLEICESDNRLAYYNGTTTFTRTDGTTWTPKEVYVYSDDKNDAFANWDGTKNCMVITNWGLMTNNSGGCTMTIFTGDCDGTSGGGGGGGESSTYITFDCLYLNTGGADLWNKSDKGAPNFYLYLFNNTTNAKKSVLATVCPDASDIFYADVPDGEWEGYLWIRKDPTNNADPAVDWNSAGVWNQTNNCKIYNDLTTITGWNNGDFTNGTYSGSCGCAGGSGDIDDDTEDYEKGTSVLLSYEAYEGTKGSWVLSAFLEALCAVEGITQYGFYLCETDKDGGCKPTADAYTYKVDATTTSPLEKYSSFNAIASDLNNAWYGYRAFVVADGETILSPNTKYFNNKCKYELTGDTVYVTIDNSLTVNNECELKFKSNF